MNFSSLLLMFVKKSAIVFLNVMVCRYRDKQVPSGRPYLVFDKLSEYSDKTFYPQTFFIRTF